MIKKNLNLVNRMLKSRRIQGRASLYTASSSAGLLSAGDIQSNPSSSFYPLYRFPSNPTSFDASAARLNTNDIVYRFREWFMSRKNPVFDRIFDILRKHEGSSADAALSRLNLYLSEALILDVLNYQKDDILSCLKFFDWAGRQPGFHLTRPTFDAIFRIILKAKLMSLLVDFLHNYMKQQYFHKVGYCNVLVIGYALAGKPEIALQLFGEMRFKGSDLDAFAYHVLLHSLVEEGYFDAVEMMAKQIKARGIQNEVTHSIIMKSYCKQQELEKGEAYLRGLVVHNRTQLSGIAVGTFVDALCKDNQFERAALLVEEFRSNGLVSMDHAYCTWIKNLVRAGRLDGALEFLKDKKAVEGYVPDVFRYNLLIRRLLSENRLEDVYDLLEEMKENEILPDNVTMNAILCFLCKAGRMDIAMGLYDLREEFGLSVNSMTYNYLINTLLGDGSIEEAYPVLKNCLEQGQMPGSRTLSIIADALCREGKLDKMKELLLFSLEEKIMPSGLVSKFISALCRASRVEEGYLMHNLLNKLNKPSRMTTYVNLISGFSKLNRGDMAATLLIEMQDKGYRPTRKIFKDVVCCLCQKNDAEHQFFRFLEMQLAHHQSTNIYNIFIYAAGQAKKPEFSRQVYEMMSGNGIKPNFTSKILLLSSYLKSGNISHALDLFHNWSMTGNNRKMWQTMITGLCGAKRPEYASQLLDNMRSRKLIPSIECYEALILLYCSLGQYSKAIDMVNDMIQVGRPVSSFIGNIFLLHTMKSRKLYDVWSYMSHDKTLAPSSWMLGRLIGVFSDRFATNHDDEDLEKLIEQCFPMDTYTYNMLLRRSFMKGMDDVYKFIGRLHERGLRPNRWTYDIIVHGLVKHGQISEARTWMEEMLHRGFDLTEGTGKIM